MLQDGKRFLGFFSLSPETEMEVDSTPYLMRFSTVSSITYIHILAFSNDVCAVHVINKNIEEK